MSLFNFKWIFKKNHLQAIDIHNLKNYCYTCQHHKSYHLIANEYLDEAFGEEGGWHTGESTGMHCGSLGRERFNTQAWAKFKCRCYQFIPTSNLDYVELCAKQKGLV